MNNLYNKIYEAIDNGIQKALIINNEQADDVSVNWHGRQISSEVDLMNYYANQLLNDTEQSYWYDQIMDCHKKGNKYKVKDSEEASDIFRIVLNMCQPSFLDWIDMSNAVTGIYYNGKEEPVDKVKDPDNIQFIRFKNFRCGHDIILNKYLMQANKSWSDQNTEKLPFNNAECIGQSPDCLELANKDFDGYKHTYNNLNIHDNYEHYPALEYCIDYNNKFTDYECYLPAKGELKFLFDICPLVNYLLFNISGEKLYFSNQGHLSSTEYGNTGVWAQTDKNVCNVAHKYYTNSMVLPLFRKK